MLCDQRVLLIVYDEKLGRMIKYNSRPDFDLKQISRAIKSAEPQLIQQYSNEDYANISQHRVRVGDMAQCQRIPGGSPPQEPDEESDSKTSSS